MKMRFDKRTSKEGVLYNVLFVPKLMSNLFWVKAVVTKGNTVKCKM